MTKVFHSPFVWLCAVICTLVVGTSSARAADDDGEVECVTTEWKLLGSNHKVCVFAFRDPDIPGVACYISQAKTGGIGGSLGLAEDPSNFAISCSQVGPIDIPAKLPRKANVFKESTCVFYRKRQGDEVIQLADSFRNMVWSIKLYRKRLQESEGKYRSLFDSGPDPIFVVDCERGTILDANPRAVEQYGYAREELVGLSFEKLGGDAMRECPRLFDEDSSPTGCVHLPKVAQYHKDGSTFWVNLHACPISYRARPAIIVSTTDITEMLEKDAQIVQAAKMKSLGEMSAGVAHELNQPLNAIRMGSDYLNMALEQGLPVPPEQLREVTLDICGQVDRATEIINTLRSFGRKSEILEEPVNLNAPVRSVLLLVEHQFLLQNVEFELHLGDALPPVKAHNNRLQQVVFNIITNARDAVIERMRRDAGLRGRITITTSHEGDTVTLSVKDNGCGIPATLREQVFQPFFTTKATGQGMGLGLAIVYGIVRSYGGDIRIDGVPTGGTEFSLTFPTTTEDGTEQRRPVA